MIYRFKHIASQFASSYLLKDCLWRVAHMALPVTGLAQRHTALLLPQCRLFTQIVQRDLQC